jgi:hypothetical protein
LWLTHALLQKINDHTSARSYDGGSDLLAPLFWPHRPADKNVSHDGQKDFKHSHNSHTTQHSSLIPSTPVFEVRENSKQHNHHTAPNQKAATTNTNNQPVNTHRWQQQ